MKKFKEFLKKKKEEEFKKPKDCPDAFFGFIRKHDQQAEADGDKKKKKLKEAGPWGGSEEHEEHHDEDHYDEDEYHDSEAEEMRSHYYHGSHPHPHDELAAHYHEEGSDGFRSTGFEHYSHTDVQHLKSYTNGSYTVNHRLINNHKYSDSHVENLCKALKKQKLPQDITVHTGSGFSPERYKTSPDQKHEITVHLPAFTSTSISHSTAKGFSKMDPKHPTVFIHDHSEDSFTPKITKLEGEDLPRHDESDSFYAREKYNERIRAKYGQHVSVHRYGHVVSMHVPKGTHGMYIGDHPKLTVHRDEYEFLLHKGSYAKVHHEPEYDHVHKIVQWKGRLVHDGAKGEPKEEDHPDQLSFDFDKK